MRVPAYTKFIVSAIGAALSVLAVALTGDSYLDATEITQVGLALLTALGVVSLPNRDAPTP